MIAVLVLGLVLTGPVEQPSREQGLLSRASLALGSAIVLSSIADAETTLLCQPGCHESNPLLVPVASSRPALHVAKLAFGAGVWTLSARLRRSERWWIRAAGWLFPLELVALQSWAAAHNWRLVPH